METLAADELYVGSGHRYGDPLLVEAAFHLPRDVPVDVPRTSRNVHMTRTTAVALVQMQCTPSKQENVSAALRKIGEAADRGALEEITVAGLDVVQDGEAARAAVAMRVRISLSFLSMFCITLL